MLLSPSVSVHTKLYSVPRTLTASGVTDDDRRASPRLKNKNKPFRLLIQGSGSYGRTGTLMDRVGELILTNISHVHALFTSFPGLFWFWSSSLSPPLRSP